MQTNHIQLGRPLKKLKTQPQKIPKNFLKFLGINIKTLKNSKSREAPKRSIY